MEVRYIDRKIEKICINEREMKRKLSHSAQPPPSRPHDMTLATLSFSSWK